VGSFSSSWSNTGAAAAAAAAAAAEEAEEAGGWIRARAAPLVPMVADAADVLPVPGVTVARVRVVAATAGGVSAAAGELSIRAWRAALDRVVAPPAAVASAAAGVLMVPAGDVLLVLLVWRVCAREASGRRGGMVPLSTNRLGLASAADIALFKGN
jgi:hypothetical protein